MHFFGVYVFGGQDACIFTCCGCMHFDEVYAFGEAGCMRFYVLRRIGEQDACILAVCTLCILACI